MKKLKRGENWEEKKENCKREGGKLEMEVGKVVKRETEVRTFFFFFFFFFFAFHFWNLKTPEICFLSIKMGIFYQEQTFHAGKKIRKSHFALSEKYACYARD